MKRLSALEKKSSQIKTDNRFLRMGVFSLALFVTASFSHAQVINGGGRQWERLPDPGMNEMKYFIQVDNIQVDKSNKNWRHATMLMHPAESDPNNQYRSLIVTFTVDCKAKTRRSDNASIYTDEFGTGERLYEEKAGGVFESGSSKTETVFMEKACK